MAGCAFIHPAAWCRPPADHFGAPDRKFDDDDGDDDDDDVLFSLGA